MVLSLRGVLSIRLDGLTSGVVLGGNRFSGFFRSMQTDHNVRSGSGLPQFISNWRQM